jgi:import inner membrane translocase subunit TIM23
MHLRRCLFSNRPLGSGLGITTRACVKHNSSFGEGEALIRLRRVSTGQSSRSLSTTSSQDPAQSSPLLQSKPHATAILDWNSFFKLRKSRRNLQLGSSLITAMAGIMAGGQALIMSDIEAITSNFPIDPFMSLGLITFSCGAVGWLTGPIVGTTIFNMANAKTKGEMIIKEKEFYERVKRYRVDPSSSNMNNPGTYGHWPSRIIGLIPYSA